MILIIRTFSHRWCVQILIWNTFLSQLLSRTNFVLISLPICTYCLFCTWGYNIIFLIQYNDSTQIKLGMIKLNAFKRSLYYCTVLPMLAAAILNSVAWSHSNSYLITFHHLSNVCNTTLCVILITLLTLNQSLCDYVFADPYVHFIPVYWGHSNTAEWCPRWSARTSKAGRATQLATSSISSNNKTECQSRATAIH